MGKRTKLKGCPGPQMCFTPWNGCCTYFVPAVKQEVHQFSLLPPSGSFLPWFLAEAAHVIETAMTGTPHTQKRFLLTAHSSSLAKVILAKEWVVTFQWEIKGEGKYMHYQYKILLSLTLILISECQTASFAVFRT